MTAGEKIAVSAISVGKSLLWNSSEYFLLAFFVLGLQLESGEAGQALFIAFVASAFVDPAIAVLIDRFRRLSFLYTDILLVGAVLSACAFVAMFAVPQVIGTSTIFMLTSLVFIFRATYAIFDVPHNALLVSITNDPHERSDLVAIRRFLGAAAGISIALFLAPKMTQSLGSGQYRDILLVIGCFAIICVAIVVTCTMFVRPQEQITSLNRSDEDIHLKNIATAIVTNRSFLALLVFTFLVHCSLPAFSKSLAFLSQSAEDRVVLWLPFTILVLSGAFSSFGWVHISRRYGKSKTLLISCLTMTIASTAFFIVGSNELTSLLIYISTFTIGASQSGIYIMVWSLTADSIGKSMDSRSLGEATSFGVFTFTNKVAIGFAALLTGALLETGEFQAQSAVMAAFMPLIAGGSLCVVLSSKFLIQLKRTKRLI